MRISRFLLLAVLFVVIPAVSFAQFGVSITIAPPALPVYTQPMVPADGYLWTPGYWAYGDEGYFWVPGTWVEPPTVGLLWTPGYWGWGGNAFAWNDDGGQSPASASSGPVLRASIACSISSTMFSSPTLLSKMIGISY